MSYLYKLRWSTVFEQLEINLVFLHQYVCYCIQNSDIVCLLQDSELALSEAPKYPSEAHPKTSV